VAPPRKNKDPANSMICGIFCSGGDGIVDGFRFTLFPSVYVTDLRLYSPTTGFHRASHNILTEKFSSNTIRIFRFSISNSIRWLDWQQTNFRG
jgi:hypothetical protein